MIRRQKTVEWVGGPFDQETFKVPEEQTSIRFGNSAMDVDLDTGATTWHREESQLPIVRRGRRHYVVWKDPG